MTSSVDLDRIDFVLLAALQENANQRLEDLGRRVGLAPSSVHERVRRLEERGLIRRWTIDCDAEALGLPVLALVGVRTSRPCSELRAPLEAMPAIEECHSVAGELSLLLKVRVENPRALLELTERLRTLPGIEGTDTTIVLATQFDRPFEVPGARPAKIRASERTAPHGKRS
jgi:Lrp/AsnC family transcriptional regulator, leucine-responsive regulatory protein